MISQKKVITQTIPTFYNDKPDFENSSENFSIISKVSHGTPLTTTRPTNRSQTSKVIVTEPGIKSVNYFGYRFNNGNRSNLNHSVTINQILYLKFLSD
jgi:hypothetical protein